MLDAMDRRIRFRDGLQARLGFASIVCVLIVTFSHNVQFMKGWFYDSLIFGAIAALAVDLGVIAVAIAKDKFLSQGENAYGLRTFAIVLGCLTALGNADASFYSQFGRVMTINAISQLDWLVLFKWAIVSIGFPLSIFIAGDIMSVRFLQGISEKSQKHQQNIRQDEIQDTFLGCTNIDQWFREYRELNGDWPGAYDVIRFNRIVNGKTIRERAAYQQRRQAINNAESVRSVLSDNGREETVNETI